MAMVAADERVTASVRRLRVGDKFTDDGGIWVVTSKPVTNGAQVEIWLRKSPNGVRSRKYVFTWDARVNIAS